MVAFGLTAVAVMVAIPATTDLAFRSGWFERSTQTRRSRGDRRPTHGGLVVALALAVGVVVTGTDGDALRATIAVVVVAVLAGHRAERDKGPSWAVPAGWLATAVAVPVLGVRAELTGTTWFDVVVTAVCVLAVTAGLDAVDHSDATASVVAAVAAGGLLAITADGPTALAPLAGVLAGATVALVAHGWPPAAVRMGAIGPMVLGPGLAVVAIDSELPLAAPRSTLVPILVLGVVAVLAPLPRLDRRLRARGLPPHIAVGVAVAAGAGAGLALERGTVGPAVALVLAVVPTGVLVLVGRAERETQRETEAAALRRRRRRIAIVAGLGAVVVVGGLSALALLSARDSMQRGKDAALAALEAARAGDLTLAQARFNEAANAFEDAKGDLDNPAVRLGGLLPVASQNLDAARGLADVGIDLSTTAVAIADRAGADDLRVTDGRFPLERARAVSEDLTTALSTLYRSVAELDRIDSPFLVSVVDDAAEEVREEVAQVTESLEVATEATRLLPSLLGAEGEQRWIVAVMSTSELRGAGGLLGDFAEVRLVDGGVEQVRPFDATTINRATDASAQAAAIAPLYAEQYGGYGADHFWQNLSVTPDVETMSSSIASAYPLTAGGGEVDGVLTIDALGLAKLLELTGPVSVPLWPEPITAENAVDVLLFQHYDQLDGAARDRFQGLVVAAVVEAVSSRSLPTPSVFASTLAPAVTGGHLRLWSADPGAEQLFRRIGADGALPTQSGDDFVQLVTQNGSEAKIDWYLDRSLSYDVALSPGTGKLLATAEVTLVNRAPASGVASYLIGGDVGSPTPAGVNRTVVTLLTPHASVRVTDGSGTAIPVNLGREGAGLYAASVVLEIPPGGTATIRYRLEGAVATSDRYRLVVGHQPTRRPDQVAVRLRTTGGWALEPPGPAEAAHEEDGPITFERGLRGP